MINWNDFTQTIIFSFKHVRVRAGVYLFLASLLALLIMLLAVWYPVNSDYSESWHKNEQLKRSIRSMAVRSELTDTYKLNKKRLVSVEKKLTVKNSQTEIINGVSRLAQRSGVNIISESYSDNTVVNGYDVLNQSLVLEGNYTTIRDFLNGIDQLSVWTVPQEVRLKRLNDETKRLSANLKLSVYTKVGLN